MKFSRCLSRFGSVALFFSVFSFGIFAGESSIGLRNPHACGLYLSSLVEDSEGLKRANLRAEEIEAYLQSAQAREDLQPRLVFKDKRTWKVIRDAEELENALREGQAEPVINTKTLNLVGLPLTGRETRRLSRLVKALVHEQMADLEVRIRVLGRPEQPGLYAETEDGWVKVADALVRENAEASAKKSIEEYFSDLGSAEDVKAYRLKGLKFRERFPILSQLSNWLSPFRPKRSEDTIGYTQAQIQRNFGEVAPELHIGWEKPATYMFHRLVYFFPLPQDYQRFTQQEVSAGKAKLAINTPVSVLSLSLTNPLAVVIPVTLTNFSQSALTAVYSVVLANWFSRSDRNAHGERLAKNAFLSSLFTVPLYWSGRGSLEAFSAIATTAGWSTFIMKKWSTVAFNVLWRFFVSNGTYKWEQIVKERADELRREDFESDEDYLLAKKELREFARATRSRIETVASTIGTVGYLLAAVMPANFVPESWGIDFFQYGWGHLIMSGLGAAGAMIYVKPELIDQLGLPRRLEAAHRGVTSLAENVRASRMVQGLESRVSAFYARRAEVEAQEGHEFLGQRDVRDFFALDDRLHQMIEERPELLELIRENRELHRLLRRHPEYVAAVP